MKSSIAFLLLTFFSLQLWAGLNVTLVCPKNADYPLQTAAKELSLYLGKVFDSKVHVVCECENKSSDYSIYLGNTDFASARGIDFSKFDEEEWMYEGFGNCLVIGGGGRRGTLYGVYHYLEDELSIHWFSPAVEVVPKRKELSFKGIKNRGKPAMRYRDIYFVSGPSGTAFLARNRMNTENAAYGGRMRYSRAGDCHTLYRYLGSPKEVKGLFSLHPDWFPLIDGKRTIDSRANSASKTQLCLTNPMLRKYFVERLRKHIANDRKTALDNNILPPMYYAIDQNDCYDGFCRCQKCQEVIDREGSTSGLLLEFTNYIAEELELDAPEATFQMMAYFSTETPPKYVRPRQNVGIRLCDPRSDLTKTWKEPVNKWMMDKLYAWSKICEKIAVWDYQITFGSSTCVSYPTPTEQTFATDLKLLAANGGEGVFFEHEEPIGADMRDLKVWMEMKLVENPNLDEGQLVKCFTDGFYGAAGVYVRRAREVLSQAARVGNAKIIWFPSISAYDFIDDKTVEELTELFDKAAYAVAGDCEKLERVNHARLSLDKLLIVRGNTSVIERYRGTWEREKARRFPKNAAKSGYKKNVEVFLESAKRLAAPSVPPKFAEIPHERLHIFPASRGVFNGEYMQAIGDESSPMFEAVRFVLNAVKDRHPELVSSFNWPFLSTVSSCPDETMTFTATSEFKATPSGYHWYKMAEKVPLTKDSVFSVFSSYSLPIGSAAANAQGGRFDIYASLRILKEDVIKKGKATGEAIYLLDQIVVVQVDK